MNQIANPAGKNRSTGHWMYRAGVIGAFVAMFAAVPAAPIAIAVQPPVVTHTAPVHQSTTPHSFVRQVNPHLHLNSLAKKMLDDKKHPHWHGHWHGYWSFYDWATVHRGLGTIEGSVHNAEGYSMASIQVVLRHPNGHSFRRWSAKHVVHTRSDGSFVMTRVRTGSYRVRASQGKANNHVSVHVSAGAVSLANIRM